MRFYLVRLLGDEVLACEYSRRAAIATLRAQDMPGEVQCVTLGVPAREAVRRLLGDMGGYAASVETVYEFDGA